jgi:dihydroorotate dehydrogenase (fumarate)
MNLETQYLGITLKNPLVPSASPLSGEVDNVKKWKMPAMPSK